MSRDSDAPIYVVNYDAMYWRERALDAEAKLAEAERRLNESIDTGVSLADTSSGHLLTAILAGAFDRVKQPP